MIPVLILPAYNRHDLLVRVVQSIDVPVGKTLIIDNGRNLRCTPEYLRLVAESQHLNISFFTPPYSSIGYGGAINFGIMQTADQPWWMWASNDVEFLPGHLATVVERMNAVTTPRIVTGGFTWGAVNRGLINTVGLVDEHSFFPIYYDDNDYHRRCDLAGVDWVEDWATGSRHGDDAIDASVTIRSDAAALNGNSRSFPMNTAEYRAKWGGLPGSEVYASPWNTGLPLWVTRPSVDARKARQW